MKKESQTKEGTPVDWPARLAALAKEAAKMERTSRVKNLSTTAWRHRPLPEPKQSNKKGEKL
jgi:hypothetical protein